MGGGLLTDLYELNMAASYLRRGMDQVATFSLFVRHLPPNRGFLVSAGLEPCLSFLEGFGFDDDDLRYLGTEPGYDEETIERFRSLRFEGDVWAVPEGRIVFADEPLLEVTAPIPTAQLIETFLLNQITFQTTIASKAARCRVAAGDRDLVDFAFRRTQGIDAAVAVARTTAMVGFAATSNVEAARRYGLRAAGTMAHSYVEAFPTEADAFRAFAQDFPSRTTFLVDTYDTANGVRNAIDVIGLRDEPPPPSTEPLLVPVMLGGKRAGPPRNLETARRLFEADLARLPEPVRRIASPEPLEAAFSDALKRLTEETRAEALRRAGAR